MATVYDDVCIVGMRKTHFEQLLAYIDERNKTHWYYGNKEQFEKRHKELREWVEGIIRLKTDD